MALLLAMAAACGGSVTPPRGPKHTPVNSPEAASACPDQRDAAKTAREELLEASGAARVAASSRAAAAVIEQAECEQQAFTAMTVDAGTQVAMTERIKVVRRQYQDARNLYEEVDTYSDARATVRAGVRLADLHEAFAKKIETLPTPVDLADPVGRASWRGDLRDLVATFQVEAALAASKALDASAGVTETDAEVTGWIGSACEKVKRLDPDGAARFTQCQ